MALFHAGTGLLLEVMAAPLRSHEEARAEDVHPALQPGDVLVADRGFCSFAHLALLMARGIHAVFRMHQPQIVDFTPDRPHARRGDKAAGTGLPRSEVAPPAGHARPTRRMDQAQTEAQVDERRGRRGAA